MLKKGSRTIRFERLDDDSDESVSEPGKVDLVMSPYALGEYLPKRRRESKGRFAGYATPERIFPNGWYVPLDGREV